MSSAVSPGDEGRGLDKVAAVGEQIVSKILSVGIDGLGPVKGAIEVAEEALSSARGDVETAVDKLIRTHVRLAGTNGFVTGLGGFATMPISVPVGLSGFYVLAARLAGGIAHLRGHDLHSEEVRSVVLVAMLGAAGTEVLKDFGLTVGTKSLAAGLKKVPGRIFIEINKKVGFRLITKAGAKGVINTSKLVPFAGGPIGAGIDATSMRSIARYARSAFDVNE